MVSQRESRKAGKLDQLVGTNVRGLRGYLRLSQEQLASRMQVCDHASWWRATVSEMERGRRTVTLSEAVDLARCLEVSLARLMQEQP